MSPVDAETGRRAALRPARRRPAVENDSYTGFLRRSIRALGERVGREGNVEDLTVFATLREDLAAAERAAVVALREEPNSYSWQAIADALGITRQAAAERWPEAKGSRLPGGQPAHLR